MKGIITLSYEKTDEGYVVNLTLPENMKAELYVIEGTTVKVNSETYYQSGEYADNVTGNVKIIEKSAS